MKLVYCLLSVFLFVGCATRSQQAKTSILSGELRELVGDFMPSPDLPKDLSGMPLKARIAITTAVAAETNAIPFFNALPARLVKEVKTDAKGIFRLRLPPGRYSVFVQLKEGWYANLIQDGLIQPVYLQKDSTTSITIKVTPKATF